MPFDSFFFRGNYATGAPDLAMLSAETTMSHDVWNPTSNRIIFLSPPLSLLSLSLFLKTLQFSPQAAADCFEKCELVMLYDLQSGVLLTRCLLCHERTLQTTRSNVPCMRGERFVGDVDVFSGCFKEDTSGRFPAWLTLDDSCSPLWT